MKYIFLDIDGVLNAPGDKNLIEGIIEPNKYNLLKSLISKTKSKVVIISSRRLYKEDRDLVVDAIIEMKKNNDYPEKLW
jgi:trehalose-6-phosphatase